MSDGQNDDRFRQWNTLFSLIRLVHKLNIVNFHLTMKSRPNSCQAYSQASLVASSAAWLARSYGGVGEEEGVVVWSGDGSGLG